MKYLDESWMNAHDRKGKAWVEQDLVTGGTMGGVKCACYTVDFVNC